MPVLARYSADQVIAVICGIPLTEPGPDTFIKIERNEDGFTLKPGAFGDGTRSRNLNHSGKITLTIMATSKMNTLLEALYAADELVPNGVLLPSLVKDNNGNALWMAKESWLTKPAPTEGAKEAPTREWIAECLELLPPVPTAV
jgi:hypothetical protein